jgi:hypothetical protein
VTGKHQKAYFEDRSRRWQAVKTVIQAASKVTQSIRYWLPVHGKKWYTKHFESADSKFMVNRSITALEELLYPDFHPFEASMKGFLELIERNAGPVNSGEDNARRARSMRSLAAKPFRGTDIAAKRVTGPATQVVDPYVPSIGLMKGVKQLMRCHDQVLKQYGLKPNKGCDGPRSLLGSAKVRPISPQTLESMDSAVELLEKELQEEQASQRHVQESYWITSTEASELSEKLGHYLSVSRISALSKKSPAPFLTDKPRRNRLNVDKYTFLEYVKQMPESEGRQQDEDENAVEERIAAANRNRRFERQLD